MGKEMKEAREKLVYLWAQIINKEIVQSNFWYLKGSSWKDIDLIGINPKNKNISLYNVKSNLNTGIEAHNPEKIVINFIDTIKILNNGFQTAFDYKLYLIYENADRFKKKSYNDDKEGYYNDVIKELTSNNLLFEFSLKPLKECVSELIDTIAVSPTTTKTHCYKFNDQYFYPFHKINELKILEIYTNYNLKTP